MKFDEPNHYTLVYQVFLFFSINLVCLQLQVNASSEKETDHLALLKFKQGITSDPHGIFNSWNDPLHFCNWTGITCGRRHQRVTSLVLVGQNLVGSISPHIGNLSFLRLINLESNTFRGEIPRQVGNLFRLQEFDLGNNSLRGEIPLNLSRCFQLKIIYLPWNNLIGKIPAELCSLRKLQMIRLGTNNLTGEIPPSLGNHSSLTIFTAPFNNLEGSIPNEMGQLKSLKHVNVGVNRLSGIISPSLFNITSLSTLVVESNQLNGSLPDNICFTLPNLQTFALGKNYFSGPVPNSLSNASHLEVFDISDNNFVGQVPSNLGNLQSLSWLNFEINNLGSNSSNDLLFLTSLTNCSNLEMFSIYGNKFGGVLPGSVANFSTGLIELYMGENEITGIIPAAMENLVNLITLHMNENLFTGFIPSQLGKLQKLQSLFLSYNQLSGQIPSSIGNLTQLSRVLLSGNKLEGSIPSSIRNCQHLYAVHIAENRLSGELPEEVLGLPSLSKKLNLSLNSLTGNLPTEVGKLKNVNTLDVSENNLSGEIPKAIGDCLSLENLNMQGNFFQGTIPSSLASLKGLLYLDFSRNNLSGQIPKDLQEIPQLQYLNLSFNDLEGEVPERGVFVNVSALSLIGNNKLCGGVPELGLPKCPTRILKKVKSHILKLVVAIACVVPTVLSILIFFLILWMRKSSSNPSFAPLEMNHLLKVSYKDLYQGTDGFSSSKLIGSGGFSSVYKGFLPQIQTPVAVKVLNLEQTGAIKSFMAECNSLGNIRHRNLVKLVTCCSSLDYKSNAFKALIFEYMGNGSLEKWLHPCEEGENQKRSLNLLQRLNIAIDVASALHYLHDLCGKPIIHCDLKPSNVLLDDDMVAHVSDFGLAKLFSINSNLSLSQISTTRINGTVGYVAPEYGMRGIASKEGDVYSYGILVLEMFSERRPTDEMFKEE
ncbi:probable LRR receptor-like serine/threonine-protein kinase At3g47570 [Hevea brasiliensis]|uniref:probable LRR receptor-like serine/threonine-protein kinase At3g47570 n=1 Tax=Hevea brasiliensis TaxID=3981 RepID=UPI0025DD11B6|nr:probable LRR receptor-like serine/threonine-protein kinase At3g47570 [Hevea brasiliensis]